MVALEVAATTVPAAMAPVTMATRPAATMDLTEAATLVTKVAMGTRAETRGAAAEALEAATTNPVMAVATVRTPGGRGDTPILAWVGVWTARGDAVAWAI